MNEQQTVTLIIEDVRFVWSISGIPGDCMNEATVTVEDAFAKVKSELKICHRFDPDKGNQIAWEFHCDGRKLDSGTDGPPRMLQLPDFLQNAMNRTAHKTIGVLRTKSAEVQREQARQQAQHTGALEIHEVLRSFSIKP